MIENRFGIISSSKEYTIDLVVFEKIIKHILAEKLNHHNDVVSIGINSINKETIFKISDNAKDEVSLAFTERKYSYSNEQKIKKSILAELFGDNDLDEELLYNTSFIKKFTSVRFRVSNKNFQINSDFLILNNPKLHKINRQIDALNGKKNTCFK